MIVYVSGPMTGLPNANEKAFDHAAAILRDQGFHVLNPADNFAGDHSLPRSAYMRIDITRLCTAHAIALLPGWQDSRGACLEVAIALELDMLFLDAMTGAPLNKHAFLGAKDAVSRLPQFFS